MIKKTFLPILALVALIALAGCSDDSNPLSPGTSADEKNGPDQNTIVDVALAVNAETGEFSTLIAALVSADLVEALDARGQRTVFAPTDAAFAALDLNADNIGELGTEALTDILLYHVAKGRRLAEDVVGSEQIRMLNGDFTRISMMDGMPYIDESAIVQTDVLADNGVIHIIDAVLLPSEDNRPGEDYIDNQPETRNIVEMALAINEASGEFSTLIAAVVSADLVDALSSTSGEFTVFAPTDAAFADLGLNADNIGTLDSATLTEILLYHVAKDRRLAEDVISREQILMLNGDATSISIREGMAYIDESTIIDTDVEASNGVIHVIDAVLLPEEDMPGFGDSQPTQSTIVDVALGVNAETGEFSTLIAAVSYAGLIDALSSEGPYTVFAPTDAAFAQLGLNAGNIETMDVEELTGILLYHVAAGNFLAADVLGREQILMLNGDQTSISLRMGMPYIDESQIIQTDVTADNGVIHVIDAVLLPTAAGSSIDEDLNAARR